MSFTAGEGRPLAPRSRLGGQIVVLLSGALLGVAPWSSAQIRDEVRVYAADSANGYAESLVRFSRKLAPLGATSVKGLGGTLTYATPIAVDGLGRSWIAFDPLNQTQLLRIDRDGVLLTPAQLGDNPVNVVIGADGHAYASTRIGLTSPGPVYGVDADGTVLWSSMSGPSLYNFGYPQQLAMTAAGELWLGDAKVVGGTASPLMVRLNPSTGAVAGTVTLTVTDAGVCSFAPSGDGTLWSLTCGVDYWLFKTQGTQILDSFPVDGGFSGVTYRTHVDAQGRPHVLSHYNEAGGWGSRLLRYNPSAPEQPDAVFQFGATIRGWAFGPTGEEVFAIVSPSFDYRLERLNLVSGAKSSVPMHPVWPDPDLTQGDPTGFLYANVVDRNGDNDGDGAANGAETSAGSNPFDPLSRPEGPKVYLSFAPTTNAILLTYVDPDGLLDPAGGLDLSTLALLTGAGTNVFSFILPFLTTVDVTPDGTQATATFGALPLPGNLKIRLEARVSDLTGALGWDWQVTPPGDL